MFDAALAAKMEANRRAADVDVPCAQRGEAVGAVVAGVAWITDANQRGFEQRHHQRHDFLARHAGAHQVLFQAFA